MERKTEKGIPEKFDKLLELIQNEEFYVSDFLFCVCANLASKKEDCFNTSLRVGDKFFDITIRKGVVQ